jgi:hypothetical protein
VKAEWARLQSYAIGTLYNDCITSFCTPTKGAAALGWFWSWPTFLLQIKLAADSSFAGEKCVMLDMDLRHKEKDWII